jgi:SNF2 family DNA or RNA helicase
MNVCELWKDMKLINPITKRPISKSGEIYKKFEKFCIDQDKNCKKLKKSPNTNPLTGNKLVDKSKILEFFKKLCNNEIKVAKKISKAPKIKSVVCDLSNSPLQCTVYKTVKLKDHQKNVCDYVKNNPDSKGLILFHSVGSGKTITAITIIRCILLNEVGKNIFVVTPASLVDNFNKEIVKLGIKFKDNVKIFSHVKFINKIDKEGPEFCENSVIIIDEAHNFKTIISAKQNEDDVKSGKRVKSLMKATRLASQVFLLTATPVQNKPEEFANLYAMVSKNEDNLKDIYKIFGKNYDPNEVRRILKNKISYFKNTDTSEYPSVTYHDVDFIMSPLYYELYKAIEDENVEKLGGGIFGGNKNLNVFINGVRRAVNNIDDNIPTPKIEWTVDFIKKSVERKNPQKVLIYSNWIKSGMRLIQDRLDDLDIDWVEVNGSMSAKKRKDAVDRFNDINNKVKVKVYVLFISSAGAEGLDLKCTRSVIILEQNWNNEKLKQVVGRAARYRSHALKNCYSDKVDVYNLILKKPEDNKDEIPAADDFLRNMANEKDKKINEFYNILIDSSI